VSQLPPDLLVHLNVTLWGIYREKWTQFKLPQMALGLLCCLLGVLWQLRRAGTALIACVCPPAGSDQDASSGDAVRRLDWGGPVEWFDMALRLLAVRPLVLPLLCAGAVFLSMAAYSDNFTIYVSHRACSAYRCVVSDSVRCTGAGYSVLSDASVPRSTRDPGKQPQCQSWSAS
jgi:hypothetical protein